MSELIAPPEPFTQTIIRCPSCNHGIDPHGLDPGGICGVGDEQRKPCLCRWQPNDIAAAQIKAGVEAATARLVGIVAVAVGDTHPVIERMVIAAAELVETEAPDHAG